MKSQCKDAVNIPTSRETTFDSRNAEYTAYITSFVFRRQCDQMAKNLPAVCVCVYVNQQKTATIPKFGIDWVFVGLSLFVKFIQQSCEYDCVCACACVYGVGLHQARNECKNTH